MPARKSRRIPVVLAPLEVRAVLDAIRGANGLYNLAARLQYGAGLRLMESCWLRVKDVDLARAQLVVREGLEIFAEFHCSSAAMTLQFPPDNLAGYLVQSG